MPFTVTQTSNRPELTRKFFGDITGLTITSVSLQGDSRAFGTFEDDPFNLTSGVVLSTGRVADLVGANTEDGGLTPSGLSDLSTDFGAPNADDDSISLRINFNSDGSKQKLFFQYVFGSEEFLEYAGRFNDSFSLSLNGRNLATLPGSGTDPNQNRAVTIDNIASTPFGPFAPDPRYANQNFLQYNSAEAGAVRSQTRLDGYTLPFTFEGDLRTGSNTLIINVKDQRDDQFDSAVFLKANTFGTTRPADINIPGLTPSVSNAAPTTVDVTAIVSQNRVSNLAGLSATDADGSITSYTILTLPAPDQGTLFLGDPAANGTAILAGQPIPPPLINQLFFQPTPNFSGSSFTYTATDNTGASDPTPANVTLQRDGTTSPNCTSCGPGQTLVGNDRDNILNGGCGADRIFGLNGNDILRGKDCQDFLDGGRGNDELLGGTGNDVITGGAGRDYLYGESGDDSLHGSAGKDWLIGGTGNDKLRGGNNRDWLFGGLGDDLVFGNKGRDYLYGRAGDDVLSGGADQDWLIGGAGADNFVFHSLREKGDIIRDFRVLERDRITISARGFSQKLKKGQLAEKHFALGSAARDQSDRFIYSSATGKLFFDGDGTGKVEQVHFATLSKGLPLTHRNFFVTQ